MNYVNIDEYAKLINSTDELQSEQFDALEALKNRYKLNNDLKAQEQDWLNKLKTACYQRIDHLDEPFKTLRQKFFDNAFSGLE